MAARPLAASQLAIVLALLPGCPGDTTKQDTRDIEAAYFALRDALLQADDEAFFAMHGSEARQWALDRCPTVRAGYLARIPVEKEAFLRLYLLTEEEFLRGDPRALAVRMMPWMSGWRQGKDMFRTARVKDVRIDYVVLPGGATERRGVVELDPGDGQGSPVPGQPSPKVVFVKEQEGWRRRAFLTEEAPRVGAPERPGR